MGICLQREEGMVKKLVQLQFLLFSFTKNVCLISSHHSLLKYGNELLNFLLCVLFLAGD